MKTIDYSKKAIQNVDKKLSEGVYGYVLAKYVPTGFWTDLLLCDTKGLIGENTTDFNYSRCFTYRFFEDIKTQQNFYIREARKEVIARGYLELFYTKSEIYS